MTLDTRPPPSFLACVEKIGETGDEASCIIAYDVDMFSNQRHLYEHKGVWGVLK